jgi:hypothetical protein
MHLFSDLWDMPITPLSPRNAPPGTSEVAAVWVAAEHADANAEAHEGIGGRHAA